MRVALMGALRIPGAMRSYDGRNAGSLHAGGLYQKLYRRDNGVSVNCKITYSYLRATDYGRPPAGLNAGGDR
ncbi:hypothetical protein EVAR_46289_1 [Eumeta japonica]|uniref:Uncharacterized protein n=1 Tax=Eumeta variegata TaxID=151549 RepID=A0A4C1XX29_EUMVA|nr:hypothetical protein EVAR_46289_1 [Eumeta japonica]